MSHRIIKGLPDSLGWRSLFFDSALTRVGKIPDAKIRPILNLIQISDTHICDAQSPARVEFLDRYADPHNPLAKLIGGLVGTYRAQEILTVQVLESMLRNINRIDVGPISNFPIDALLLTGDLTDNAQQNELNWVISTLDGEPITPDSGSVLLWEGIGGSYYSEHFWNPHGTPAGEIDDSPRRLYGFPVIPELLNAVRAPFDTSGSRHPWLAVHGNHDLLLQGTVCSDLFLNSIATSSRKFIDIETQDALETLSSLREVGPAHYPKPTNMLSYEITPDHSRQFVNPHTWPQRMTQTARSHGFQLVHRGTSIKYWRKDFERATILALDTVNPFGGWQGSIDEDQFKWLSEQLHLLRNRHVVIASHHPLQDLFNTYSPEGEKQRIGREQIEKLLIGSSNVLLWIAGHTHRNKILFFGTDDECGFWQIETSSLIDWPQQGRIIEIVELQNEGIFICISMIDHAGKVDIELDDIDLSDIDSLSGLSRLLSVNDWQRRNGSNAIESNEGLAFDQNVILRIPLRERTLRGDSRQV